MAATLIVLAMGLIQMVRGKLGAKSNKLMQMRITFQIIALIACAVILYVVKG